MTEFRELSTGPLVAGPWTVTLSESGRLSHLKLEGLEVLRGVFVVVRDDEWGTIPCVVEIIDIQRGADSFDIALRAEHVGGLVDFAWTGRIMGSAAGVIRYEFEGEARSDFLRNRIGFVVLHPLHWAGTPCTLVHPDGSVTVSSFPEEVAPHQPFKHLAALHHEVLPGTVVEIAFEGEIFETEDQRNWSDASFKTYGTPLSLPFPVQVNRGERICQAIVVAAVRSKLHNPITVGSIDASDDRVPTVTIDPSSRFAWPALGTGLALDQELRRDFLADLGLAHLRVDLRVHPDRIDGLEEFARVALTRIPIELALHLNPAITGIVASDSYRTSPSFYEARSLGGALAAIASSTTVAAVIVYTITEPTTTLESFQYVVREIATQFRETQFFVGTDDNFAELNRNPISCVEYAAGGVAFSLTPQIHDVDDRAIMETIEAMPSMIATARSLAKTDRVSVSPITLKPRRNIYGTRPRSTEESTIIAPPIDPRQGDQFTAAWMVGALSALVQVGVSRLTFFEHAGPRGLALAGDSSPTERFPVFKVFAALADVQTGVTHIASEPAKVTAVACLTEGAVRVILANLTAVFQHVEVRGLGAKQLFVLNPYETRTIDEPLVTRSIS